MKRMVIGSLLAAVALFLWGFLYWNVLPLRYSAWQPVGDEEALATQLRDALPASGVYLLPHPNASSMEESLERFQRGPLAEIVFMRDGAEPFAPFKFIAGFLHMLVAALIMGWVLRMAGSALGTYGSRVGLVVVAGLAGAFFAHLDDPIWYHHPWNVHVIFFAYDLTCWVLVGLIQARFVRPAAAV